ncbi:PREDICTED: doublecortin domain-containing protein 2C [Elephantulus edwardii]|uniref:doublecortin domain-containing protein 2C n=1 Tax=Elephantulus edwardii TaxID=28737 RepID=UPI0003F0C8B7|nr:PREDICTED: doublecortin domain-containing protein 2C [Elephantulus edwardii]
MGTRAPYSLIDTTPAKIFLVYRNGDQYYVGKKFVFNRRRVASFEAFLNQLNEEITLPFGVQRIYTPMHGHLVQELDSLQQGGKYVAAGRERFKKLDYFHIVPRKPMKMRKPKEIKPVVHCDINVPSRWQTFNRVSRHINVFTNGRLYIPPAKIIIPKFCLSRWDSVLALIGEKVFPLGGVRKSYADAEKTSRRKKKEDPEGKSPPKYEATPAKKEESVYYAKERKEEPLVKSLITSGPEGDVYKARTSNTEIQGATDVKEDQDVKVEVPVDQLPAEIVKEDEDIQEKVPDLEENEVSPDKMLKVCKIKSCHSHL